MPKQRRDLTTSEVQELRQRVTELQRALHDHDQELETLRASERLHRSVLDTAGSIILCLDADYRIVEWNRAAERLYGRHRAEVMGENYLQLFLPESVRASVAADIQKVLHGAPTEGFENPVRTADGTERLLLWNVSPLVGVDGVARGIVAVGQDITERARAEDARRRLEHWLQQAEKLESLEALAGGIAAEFNHLLTRILRSAARCRVVQDGHGTEQEIVREVERAARDAINIANQMATYAGRRSFELYALFLNRHIEETTDVVQALLRDNITLSYELAPGLPPLMAHSGHLQQMLINLVANAADALETKAGQITIATGLLDADARLLRETYLGDQLSEGEYVYLEVTDDGVGMHPDVRAKMFDPFFSTNVPKRGLGLAAVLGIVRGHGGGIHVTSAPGKGTRIRVLFPIPPNVPFDHLSN